MEIEKKVVIDFFGSNFENFFTRYLPEAKLRGNEFSACCPFCDDQHPSFSANSKTGLWFCHKCGASGDFLKFYANKHGLNGDFPAVLRGIASDFGISDNGAKPERERVRKDKERKPAERKRLVKAFDYLNLQSLLQFQKVRYEPKSFALRRPDGLGGWIWDIEGVEPVLYNLLAVLKAGEVWVVEGEKDCGTLGTVGIISTTIFDGASGKWRESYTQVLKGKRIRLIPDDDEPGKSLMQRVAAALHGVAASLKILNLPNPANKKGFDVSDFIADQDDPAAAAERLRLLADEAAEWTPPPKSEPSSKSSEEETPRKSYHETDTGNGERFADNHRDSVRFCFPANRWSVWDGMRWKQDNEGTILQLAKQTTRGIYADARSEPDSDKSQKIGKWAAASESSFRQVAMISMARSEPGIPILPEQLDAYPMLLNVKNGIIDLSTGDLLPHDKKLLLTKLVNFNYDPDAFCPRWLEFLEMVTGGDDQLVDYLCRVAGYALTGQVGEQCFFLLWGTGQNGKSTFLNVLQTILNDYALQTDFNTFVVKKNDSIRNDIARLKNTRMVTAIESGDGNRLDEQVIKQLTGTDKVTARFLHQEFFDYRPEYKIFLAANQKPTIYGQDLAIWRRVRLIPFTVKIPDEKRIQDYEKVLLEEAEGILSWAVFGCLEWQKMGELGHPAAVETATKDYRSEMDVLEDFLNCRCVFGSIYRIPHAELYENYIGWCETQNDKPFKTRTFSKMLESRGFKYVKPKNLKTWLDLGIK